MYSIIGLHQPIGKRLRFPVQLVGRLAILHPGEAWHIRKPSYRDAVRLRELKIGSGFQYRPLIWAVRRPVLAEGADGTQSRRACQKSQRGKKVPSFHKINYIPGFESA